MVMVTNDDNVLIMLFRAVEKYIIIIIIIKMRMKLLTIGPGCIFLE